MNPHLGIPSSFTAPSPAVASSARAVYLRRVYGWFTTSIVAAAGGALFALYAGAGSSAVTLTLRDGSVASVPPIVALLSSGWVALLISYAVMFGAFTAASWVRNKPVLNVLALHGAALVSGVFLAPMLFAVQLYASQGMTLSTAPIRDAFLLTVASFTGLSGYALISKRDFSFLRGMLTMGLFVLFGAIVLNLFLGSAVFQLAIASVGVLLFGGYILYDTSRLMREAHLESPVGAALRLFLDFFNLFVMLLSILGSRRD